MPLSGGSVKAYFVPVQPGPDAGPSACTEAADLSIPSSALGSIGSSPLKPRLRPGPGPDPGGGNGLSIHGLPCDNIWRWNEYGSLT